MDTKDYDYPKIQDIFDQVVTQNLRLLLQLEIRKQNFIFNYLIRAMDYSLPKYKETLNFFLDHCKPTAKSLNTMIAENILNGNRFFFEEFGEKIQKKLTTSIINLDLNNKLNNTQMSKLCVLLRFSLFLQEINFLDLGEH